MEDLVMANVAADIDEVSYYHTLSGTVKHD